MNRHNLIKATYRTFFLPVLESDGSIIRRIIIPPSLAIISTTPRTEVFISLRMKLFSFLNYKIRTTTFTYHGIFYQMPVLSNRAFGSIPFVPLWIVAAPPTVVGPFGFIEIKFNPTVLTAPHIILHFGLFISHATSLSTKI